MIGPRWEQAMNLMKLASQPVVTVDIRDHCRHMAELMSRFQIRYLPVLHQGLPVGMVSDRDLLSSIGHWNSDGRHPDGEGAPAAAGSPTAAFTHSLANSWHGSGRATDRVGVAGDGWRAGRGLRLTGSRGALSDCDRAGVAGGGWLIHTGSRSLIFDESWRGEAAAASQRPTIDSHRCE
jgi:hypothetical protein